MKNKEKYDAGLFLIVGFKGKEPDKKLEKFIREIKPLGIIFFDRNIENLKNVRELNVFFDEIFKNRGVLKCIDQEGGYVARIKEKEFHFPSPMALCELSCKTIEKCGFYSNIILNSLGFNVNFAPVLDLFSEKYNSSIGVRCFSNSKEKVIKCAKCWLEGGKKTKILFSGKHFPGLGPANTDSHRNLPICEKEFKDYLNEDIQIFKKIVESKIDIIMVGHMLVKVKNRIQYTLTSNYLINEVLRKKLKYNGLVVSDDLEMGAVTKNFNIEKISLKAIQNGIDALLICKKKENIYKVKKSIEMAIKYKKIDEATLKSTFIRKIRILKKAKGIISISNLNNFRKSSEYWNKLSSKKQIKVIKKFKIQKDLAVHFIYLEKNSTDVENKIKIPIREIMKNKKAEYKILKCRKKKDVLKILKENNKGIIPIFLFDEINVNKIEERILKYCLKNKIKFGLILIKTPKNKINFDLKSENLVGFAMLYSVNYYAFKELINKII